MSTRSDLPGQPDSDADEASDAAFDELARRAGAALRRPAPEEGMQAIVQRQHRHQLLKRTIVGGIAVATIIVGLGVMAGRNDRDALTPADSTPSTESAPETTEGFDVPEDQMSVIRELVGAVSRGDADGFIDQFASDGSFNTRGVFTEGEWYGFNDGARLYSRETSLVEAWFAMNGAWGFEAELRSCSSSSVVSDGFDQSVACEVAVRWPKLSLEIVEGWAFELRGDEVTWWGTSADPEDLGPLDLDPSERSLPLGYADIEDWEGWLEANDPEDASIWLNPRNTEEWIVDAIGDPELAARVAPLLTPAQNSWLIDKHEFTPFGLIPYDPTFADEIQASIREYLASR